MHCSYQPVGTIKRNLKQVELHQWFSVLSRLLCSYNINQSVVTINNNLKRAKTKQPFFLSCLLYSSKLIYWTFLPTRRNNNNNNLGKVLWTASFFSCLLSSYKMNNSWFIRTGWNNQASKEIFVLNCKNVVWCSISIVTVLQSGPLSFQPCTILFWSHWGTGSPNGKIETVQRLSLNSVSSSIT